MMWHPSPLQRRGFGSADIEIAIKSYRIAINDLASEALRHCQGKVSLAAAGGAENDHEQRKLLLDRVRGD